MRYVVIGAAGQLGRDLAPRLHGDVVPLDRTRADLTQPEMLRAVLTDIRPEVVVNCAAYNFVDRAETERDAAFAANAWGVRSLAGYCRDLGCTLVHFSTDYVFGLDGNRKAPLTTTDPPGPLSVYGMSKLCGEFAVRSECPRHYVIRTCGLYGVWGAGGKGGNFVETMLRLAAEGKPIRVVNDQQCTPSYTADVAATTAALIASGRFGLYHVTNTGATNWYEVAKAAFEILNIQANLTAIPTRDYPTPARRPSFSVLALDELSQASVPQPRPWREALAAYLEERTTKRGA
jgi:dTDP-4-dehydrorhamnose reductase